MLKKFTPLCIALLITGCASITNGTYKIAFPTATQTNLDGIKYSAKITTDQRPGIYSPVRITLMLMNESKKPISTNMFSDSLRLYAQDGTEYAIQLSDLTYYSYDGKTVNPGNRITYELPIWDKGIHAMILNGQLKTMLWTIGKGAFLMDAKYPEKK